MNLKVKQLYIFTIAAILSLLAIQSLWLYNQFRMTVNDEKVRLLEALNSAISDYRYIRFSYSDKSDSLVTSHTKSSINYAKKHPANMDYVHIEILHQTRKIRDILNLSENHPITKNDKEQAGQILADMPFDSLHGKIIAYDVERTTESALLYDAVNDATNELRIPFTKIGIDSILRKKNIEVETTLLRCDSLMWKPYVTASRNLLKPELTILYPYSPLDHKCVEVRYKIPFSDILRALGLILILSLIMSVLLIICLVCQIRMIFEYVRLDAVRNSFVHTMIHELKRPLSTLKICISALSNTKMMASERTRQSILDNCRCAVNNLSTYFSRLRDITFNEASQIPLEIEPCNMRHLIEDVINKTDKPSSKKVSFTVDCDEDLHIACDRLHMEQMLGNLIENAVKYSNEEVNIEIKARKTPGYFEVSVIDNGIGITENDIKKIFQKFYRSDAAMRSGAPGVGLGLAYVSLLAEAHGGSVRVESEQEKGSCFTILIPQ